jgi:hypothetical protein
VPVGCRAIHRPGAWRSVLALVAVRRHRGQGGCFFGPQSGQLVFRLPRFWCTLRVYRVFGSSAHGPAQPSSNYAFKRTAGTLHRVSCRSFGPRPLNAALDWCACHVAACCTAARCRAQEPRDLVIRMQPLVFKRRTCPARCCVVAKRSISHLLSRRSLLIHLRGTEGPRGRCVGKERGLGLGGWRAANLLRAVFRRLGSNGARSCAQFASPPPYRRYHSLQHSRGKVRSATAAVTSSSFKQGAFACRAPI